MRTILACCLIFFSCDNQSESKHMSQAVTANLVIKYQVIFASDTPCCKDLVLKKLALPGVSQVKWEKDSKIIEIAIDSTDIKSDSLLILLNKLLPNQIRFSKLYEATPDLNSPKDTDIIITTPKTEEELEKEKEKISV